MNYNELKHLVKNGSSEKCFRVSNCKRMCVINQSIVDLKGTFRFRCKYVAVHCRSNDSPRDTPK